LPFLARLRASEAALEWEAEGGALELQGPPEQQPLAEFAVLAIDWKPHVLPGIAASSVEDAIAQGRAALMLLAPPVMIVLSTLSQAIVLYGAFQDMRGRPVSLTESLQVGLRRFFPIIGLAISMTLLGVLAAIAFIIPAFILFTMWFVATPACVVEQLGPSNSMRRSSQLTKGHKWKIFGLMLLLIIASGVASQTITVALTAIGGEPLALIGDVLWNGVWGAFYAISVVVTYHDLRVAKEGIDGARIEAWFRLQ
jgi:hypothetical protein